MYIYNPIEDCYATKKKIDFFRKEIERRSKEKKKIEILDYGCGNANAVSYTHLTLPTIE